MSGSESDISSYRYNVSFFPVSLSNYMVVSAHIFIFCDPSEFNDLDVS